WRACRPPPRRGASAGACRRQAVRPVAKEEIKSLGAAFIGHEDEESRAAQTSGGCAKPMSAAFLPNRPKCRRRRSRSSTWWSAPRWCRAG
ncbi:MAG: hypothetical protein AVDCRST_MAG04-433, partial [uncultured Acetobacteraceae bacterium]